MDFFKVSKKFIKSKNLEKDSGNGSLKMTAPQLEAEPQSENATPLTKTVDGDDDPAVTNSAADGDDDDDDDDFITNEIKRRLKELRRNSFMVLIPEEDSFPEEEEEEEEVERATSSTTEWRARDIEAEGRQWWGGFDLLYDTYCERMLFFDRMSAQQLLSESGGGSHTPSPRSASKKLPSPLRCLSLKRFEEPDDDEDDDDDDDNDDNDDNDDDDDEARKLQQQPENDHHHLYQEDLETAYVGRICLAWEALHCQFTQLSQRISCQPENTTTWYNHCAQKFQQFQVLLQRFMENEPFEQQGPRLKKYARARKLLPNLLQVPNIRAPEPKEEEGSDMVVLATDLIKIVESSILTFHLFLKMEKKRSSSDCIYFFGNQNHNTATPLQQVQSCLDKKVTKLKDIRKKRKGWKKKSWPQTCEDVELLFGLMDVKILTRVLRMEKITKEQLLWCEEKMKKLDFSDGKLQRDPSPLLFPC